MILYRIRGVALRLTAHVSVKKKVIEMRGIPSPERIPLTSFGWISC